MIVKQDQRWRVVTPGSARTLVAMSSGATRRRGTRQEAVVRDALSALDGFRSAQDVYAALRQQGETVGLSTVYRHLQSFADAGEADVIHTPDGETTYRYCGEQARHHHHLVCRRCGSAVEIEGRALERWAASVGEEHGYVDVDHTVELFGTCKRCAEAL